MRLPSSTLLFALFFLCPPGAIWAQQRNIRETDLFKFTWMADPQLTADAAEAAYVLVDVDPKREGCETRIWSVATASGEARPSTTGARTPWCRRRRDLIRSNTAIPATTTRT